MLQIQESNNFVEKFIIPSYFLLEDENQNYFININNSIRINEGNSIFLKTFEDIKILKIQYSFKEEKEIEIFLDNNKFLIEILIEAKNKIINIFRQNVELLLELHKDYEEDFEELFIIIKAFYSPEEMITLANKLDEAWFLNRMDDTKGKLNITVESL
ncbi:MAG: hypothetical protein HY934_10110 [Candidatus Firestonebacteria bacterium]|nr:hypothetical protein [Candidatus Firestonebacteria bacterium]